MIADVRFFWRHAENALRAARNNLAIDPSTAGSRAYYAAFYAVSALFMFEGKLYRKHSAVESAVHRDLVNTGRWSKELGAVYRNLHKLRGTADYEMLRFLSEEEAQEAVRLAETIVAAVRETCPDVAAE